MWQGFKLPSSKGQTEFKHLQFYHWLIELAPAPSVVKFYSAQLTFAYSSPRSPSCSQLPLTVTSQLTQKKSITPVAASLCSVSSSVVLWRFFRHHYPGPKWLKVPHFQSISTHRSNMETLNRTEELAITWGKKWTQKGTWLCSRKRW